MRQTVLPTRIHGTTAPTRSESFARRVTPGIPFGAAPRSCVLAFPSPPNQVDRRVTRPRNLRAPCTAPAAVKSSKMPNKMLIDATHPEETRVVVVRGNRVEEFD